MHVFGQTLCWALVVFSKRAFENMRIGNLPVANMRWPRRPKLGLWKPPVQQSFVSGAVPSVVSHFDDPEYELPDEE